VTSVARTLCDLSAVAPVRAVERATDEALRRKLVSLGTLERVAADLRCPGRARSTVTRSILEARVGSEAGESPPEGRIARLLVRAGLPRPTHQHRVRVNGRTVRIDLAYPDAMVAIEYDGWDYHRTRRAFDRDRARANDLEVLGWTVLRFTSASTDQAIVDTVRAALLRACVV
jgi:G:T-mismatch repair DNA endonuclease (very short patch repair protein)